MAMDRTRPGLSAYAVGKMAHFALMIVAAAEGAPYGIRANAVAPAARTRMLTRPVEPGDLLGPGARRAGGTGGAVARARGGGAGVTIATDLTAVVEDAAAHLYV